MRLLVSCLLLMMTFSGACWAKVDLRTTKPLVIPEDKVTPKITKEDVAKIIPLDIKKDESTGSVMSRIADRGFNLWFNSEFMKNSALGRAVEETQEKLKTDVVVPASTPHGVVHKFSFRVEAFQALAKMEYSGWLKAAINYDAKASETDIQFKDKVLDNKDLIVSHKANKEQGLSMIGLAWSW